MIKINLKIASAVLTMLIISGSMCTTAYADNSSQEKQERALETLSQAGFISKDFIKEDLSAKISRSNYEELLDKLNNKLNVKEVITESSVKSLSTPSTETPLSLNPNTVIAKDVQEEKLQNALKTVKPLDREEALSKFINVLIASNINLELSENIDNIKLYDDYKDISKGNLAAISTALQNGIVSIDETFLLNPKETPTYGEILLWLENVQELYAEKSKEEDPFYILDPSQKIKVNPEVDKDGNIIWNTVNNVKYYTVIVKDSNGNVVLEQNIYRDTVLDPTKILEKGNTYIVTIGVILEDDTEVYSLPIEFKYSGLGDKIVNEVKKYLGINYVWGGSSPSGFDCSGLTQYVCSKVGVKIERTADDQYHTNGTYVSRDELKPGDLVYFGKNNHANHAGIYVGNGQMIHAPQKGDVVKYSSIDNGYFKDRFLGGKRL